MADFIALLKAQPAVSAIPDLSLAAPGKTSLWLLLHRRPTSVLGLAQRLLERQLGALELNSAWGLPDGQTWDLYRWYPEPARLQGDAAAFNDKRSIALRPFEIVLLGAVPTAKRLRLNRTFESRQFPSVLPTRANNWRSR